jgi:hypothetical protein
MNNLIESQIRYCKKITLATTNVSFVGLYTNVGPKAAKCHSTITSARFADQDPMSDSKLLL